MVVKIEFSLTNTFPLTGDARRYTLHHFFDTQPIVQIRPVNTQIVHFNIPALLRRGGL